MVSAGAEGDWADRLLQAKETTSAIAGVRHNAASVRADEAFADERTALWKAHIHDLRPTRNARQEPDPKVRLLVLERV